jgi:hypothetical protein
LSQARRDLTALASLSRGDIAVSGDGELIYSFPSNLKGVLAANSQKYKATATVRKAWPAIFYGIRVSFGVVLLTSLFAIFSTILFISASSSSSDDNRRRDRGYGGGGMNFGGSAFWGPSPFDFFYYRPYYGYYYSPPGQPRRDPDEMGFLESVFSYIFGDGDPNEGLEEKRLQLASNMIRQNNGAVTAEQLAVFCDDIPSPDFERETSFVDEVRNILVMSETSVVLAQLTICFSCLPSTEFCVTYCHSSQWRTSRNRRGGHCLRFSRAPNVSFVLAF